MDSMYAIYRAVTEQGGVVEVSSTGDFPKTVIQLEKSNGGKTEILDPA